MNKLPLFAPEVPMIGRAQLFQRMVGALTKATPQSLSLVGPRYSGKSVILSELANSPEVNAAYLGSSHWDLGHHIPQSDEEFIAMMKRKLSDALAGKNDTIAEHLAQKDAGYDDILDSFDSLAADKKRIIMLWDGMDRTIMTGKLTRNLWDNLLALGRKSSLVLVLSSRKKLQELIRDAQSVTSEFWQMFDVVRLEPLEKDDVEAFVKKMDGPEFHAGAVTELMNWTGGIPPLVAFLLNRMGEATPSGLVTNAHVSAAVAEIDEQGTDILESIWKDLPAPVADVYRNLAESGPQSFTELPKLGRSALMQAGLMSNQGGQAYIRCRLMQQHIGSALPEYGALARLFGTREAYSQHIRGILERRINQIERFDESLFHMVERAIEDIPLHPDTCLTTLTGIEDRAFELIWVRECDSDRCLPPDVISYWTETPRDEHWWVLEAMKADEKGSKNAWGIRGDRGPQLTLLQLLTGSHQDFSRKTAKYTSKDTYVLLNAIHSFRNRSQHGGGEVIRLGVAVSAVMLCVELLECLSREARD